MLSGQNKTKIIKLFKICIKCKIPKPLCEFYNNTHYRLNVANLCKSCSKISQKEHYKANRHHNLLRQRKYNKMHENEISLYQEKYNRVNREKILIRQKIYNKKHRKEYNKWLKEKRKTEPKYKLNHNMSSLILVALKRKKAGRHWENLVGYTIEKLKIHLEKQFDENMAWDNYGKEGWEVDHTIPVSVFNYTKPEHEDFKRCWALKNLQPMWAKENKKKSNKLNTHFQQSLLLEV